MTTLVVLSRLFFPRCLTLGPSSNRPGSIPICCVSGVPGLSAGSIPDHNRDRGKLPAQVVLFFQGQFRCLDDLQNSIRNLGKHVFELDPENVIAAHDRVL